MHRGERKKLDEEGSGGRRTRRRGGRIVRGPGRNGHDRRRSLARVVLAWIVVASLGLLALGLLAWGLAGPAPGTLEPPSRQRDLRAQDGTWVASKGEQRIADELHARDVAYRYEPELAGGLTPDFHVEGTDVLIEYWGMAGEPGYEERMVEKMEAYEEHGYDVIGLFPAHVGEMGEVLERELAERGIVGGSRSRTRLQRHRGREDAQRKDGD